MCQRLVCQKREFTVRSSSCEVYDPKLKNEIDMNSQFTVVETVVVCQKLLHVYEYVLV